MQGIKRVEYLYWVMMVDRNSGLRILFPPNLHILSAKYNPLKQIINSCNVLMNDFRELQQKSKQVIAQVSQSFKSKSQRVIEQVTHTTKEITSELTEEAIIIAVDRAINVIQVASQEVRERNIPTENVALEVSVKIMGVVELKMTADVPKEEQIRKVILDTNSNSQ